MNLSHEAVSTLTCHWVAGAPSRSPGMAGWTEGKFQRLLRCAILTVGILSLATSSFAADQPVATVDWGKLETEGRLKSGELVPGEMKNSYWLKITNTETGMRSIPLCEIDSPSITSPSYMVRGRIRYQKVVGVGFLEMWNHFGADQQYFTRTMSADGPMQFVTGTSAERDFILPFHTGGQTSAPSKLVINLVLKGPGTVEIGPLELVAIPPMAGSDATATGWWSSASGGLIGGIGGSLLGIVGALIGTMMGLGRAKKLVLALAAFLTAGGAITLVTGIVALISRQPYAVYYVLLLLGGMSMIAGLVILFTAPMQFRALELRRMQALDT